MQPTRTDKQERATLRSGIMMATRNPANEREVAKSCHAPPAILAPSNGIAKSETGSGKDKASGQRSKDPSGKSGRRTLTDNERIQPVGESTRSWNKMMAIIWSAVAILCVAAIIPIFMVSL